jgi:hypothetical protein
MLSWWQADGGAEAMQPKSEQGRDDSATLKQIGHELNNSINLSQGIH